MPITHGTSGEQTRRGVNAGIYGPGGAGKTTLLDELADCEYAAPVYVCDVEGGATVLSHRNDIHVASITDLDERGVAHGYADLAELIDKIIAGKSKMPDGRNIGTLVLDNMSETLQMCVNHVKRTISRNIEMKDRPDQNDWGKVNSELLVLIRKMRDWSRNSGTNVFWLAWDMPEQNELGQTYKQTVKMNPAFRTAFPGIIDHLAYLTPKGKGVRQLSFDGAKADAKLRRNLSEVANTIPLVIEYDKLARNVGKTHTPLADILATLKGGVPFPVSKYTREGKTA